LIQQAVNREGHRIRRVLSITEFERFYAPAKQVVTRTVFDWDPVKDAHRFKGMFNSYILEDKIATMLGYTDKRNIYDELHKRTVILKELVKHRIFNYFDVWEILKKYHFRGVKALPFELRL
jgi:flagellar protein FlaI